MHKINTSKLASDPSGAFLFNWQGNEMQNREVLLFDVLAAVIFFSIVLQFVPK